MTPPPCPAVSSPLENVLVVGGAVLVIVMFLIAVYAIITVAGRR